MAIEYGLAGKRAFVSGSSSGIGAATARLLASQGALVVVHGRDEARANQVRAEIAAEGGEAIVALGALDSDAAVAEIAASVDAAFGGIDILVSNAGDSHPFATEWFSVTPAQWAANYDANVIAAVRLTNAFVPAMRARGWGRIVMIGSNTYSQPAIAFPAYGPSKAALVNLTVSLARVLANTGVTANIISPGAVLTETMASNLLTMAEAEGWQETDPDVIERRLVTEKWPNSVGRMGRPAEIAAAVAFVASGMAGYMSGANIRINGGEAPSMH